MIKIYFLLAMIFAGYLSTAQNAANYLFNTATGVALEDLSTGATSLLGPGEDDASSAVITLPFNFTFAGTVYNQFSASSNGLIGFGAGVVNSEYSNAITVSPSYPILMPFWDDLHTGSNGDVRYKITGSAGSRKLVVQWNVSACCDGGSFDRTFQAWLFEGTNINQLVYGAGLDANSSSIGIASSGADYLSVTVSSNTSTSASANDNNAVWPGNGRSYIFNPASYYRTLTSGNWSTPATWETATDAAFTIGLVSPATLAPNYTAHAITIRSPHTVTATANVTTDETTVNSGGTITVNSGITLTINDGAGADITVNGTVNGSGNMTIKSNSSGTASVGNSSGSITVASTVERFIPDDGHRAWRLLSVPVTGSQTIYQAWQDTAMAHSGYATLITSNLYSGANGFDMASNSASILAHAQGGGTGPSWVPLTNTNAITLSSNPGYMLFVRGDRNATTANALIGATTLRSTGTLKQGTQSAITVSSTGTGYTLVGNPYASPIDFESIAGTANLSQSYYTWNANLAGKYGVGGFRLVERTGLNTYRQTPQNMDGTNGGATVVEPTLRYLHSGQAFFLKASGSNAGVVFTEASKAIQTSVINPFREAGTEQQLMANLLIVDADNTTILADGIRANFGNTFSASVTGEDITKMSNFSSENLGLKRDNKVLIVEKRPEITSDDTLFLNLANTAQRSYRLQVSSQNIPSTLMAYLFDDYLNTQTVIDLTTLTNIDFSVNATAASAAPDRFKIVFKTAGTLPVTLSSIKAYQQDNRIVVEWKVQTESGIKYYDVEKSTDGRTFGKAGTQVATGNNNSSVYYRWADVNALTGNNFYRISSVGVNGEIKLSEVVKVIIGKGKAGYAVYPNPLGTNNINLQFINQAKGTYEVKLLNNTGQVVLRIQIKRGDGSSSESIPLGTTIAKGNYALEITAPDKSKHTIKIIR